MVLPQVVLEILRKNCRGAIMPPILNRVNVATGGHCYAALIKTDIHLIAFDQPVHWEIQLIALTLTTSSKAPAPEQRLITRDSY